MKATIPYIERKFDEFNQNIFDGKLPKLTIELSDAKTFMGKCGYRRRRLPNGEIELYDFRLRINKRFDLPEQELEDIIIHEMIHYYIGVNRIKDTSAHGQVFKSMMNSVNKRFGRHITISHKSTDEQREQAFDTKKRWHVVALVFFKDGRMGIKVLPRVLHRITNYYNAFSRFQEVKEVKLYMTYDAYFNRYPNSSVLAVTFVDNEEEVMSRLNYAEQLMWNGTNYEKLSH